MPSDDFDRDSDRGRDPDRDSGWGRDSDDTSGWGSTRDRGRDFGGDPDSDPDADASPPADPSPSGDPSPAGASAPTDPSSPGDSASFWRRLEDGWERALGHPSLAVVPLLSSLLAVDNVRRVLDYRGIHFGVTFRFPSALPDLWTFVSVPSQGSGVHVSPTLFALPVLILFRGVLVAGLIGSVHEAIRTGEYDFKVNARRYFAPAVAFVALVHVAGLATVSAGAVAIPLVVLFFPLFVLLSYVFYATPYLLVVADLGVGEALTRSYEWALAGGPYFAYGAGYLLFVVGVSVVGTALVVNLGAFGILVGAVASAPVALALTFATTGFVADLADARFSADAATRPDQRRWE